MKSCSRCHKIKPLSEFSFKNKEKKKYNSYCKECNKSYNRLHYINNKSEYLKKSKKWRFTFRSVIRSKLLEYLRTHPCVDCGELDPTVLEFDHIKAKTNNVSSLLYCDASWDRLLKEMEKCEVRCANCHKRRTAKQFSWYKYIN